MIASKHANFPSFLFFKKRVIRWGKAGKILSKPTSKQFLSEIAILKQNVHFLRHANMQENIVPYFTL